MVAEKLIGIGFVKGLDHSRADAVPPLRFGLADDAQVPMVGLGVDVICPQREQRRLGLALGLGGSGTDPNDPPTEQLGILAGEGIVRVTTPPAQAGSFYGTNPRECCPNLRETSDGRRG